MKQGPIRREIASFTLAAFLLSGLMFLAGKTEAAESGGAVPDKALCAEMIRFGKQSYERGRYLDAKEYFRKAVKADPSSASAWKHYDMAVIYALAEKVNKDANLIAPDVSPQGPPAAAAPPPPPPPQKPEPAKKPKFKIVEDEGC